MSETESSALLDLTGKTAFVTGGMRGIGFAVASALTAVGAHVVIADLDKGVGEAAAQALGGEFALTDVTSGESIRDSLATVVRAKRTLDIAVNCAGVSSPGAAEETEDAAWEFVYSVNAAGVFKSAREEGRLMLPQGWGSIVNIASMSGSVVNRPQKQVAYNSSKAAVVMLTKTLAVEWAERGVRVNSVSPGYVETPMTAKSRSNPERIAEWMSMTPMKRIAKPSEIAAAVTFLVSDAASYITGHDLIVDGGYTAL